MQELHVPPCAMQESCRGRERDVYLLFLQRSDLRTDVGRSTQSAHIHKLTTLFHAHTHAGVCRARLLRQYALPSLVFAADAADAARRRRAEDKQRQQSAPKDSKETQTLHCSTYSLNLFHLLTSAPSYIHFYEIHVRIYTRLSL